MEAPETNSKTEEPEKKYTVSGPSEACMCEGEYDEGCVDMLSTFVEKIESNLRHMCSESNAYDVIFLSARQFEVTMDVLSICDIEGCREEDVMDVFWQEHLNIIRLYKSAGWGVTSTLVRDDDGEVEGELYFKGELPPSPYRKLLEQLEEKTKEDSSADK